MFAGPINYGEGAVGGRVPFATTLFTPIFQHRPSRLEGWSCARA